MTAIPITRPRFAGGEAAALAEALASGWVSQGPRVRAFEEVFAARVGAADAVATSNCTTALALALHVSGVGPGDEVIVPSLSFIATANAVVHCGARPVFADVDPFTLNLDPAAAERAVTPRTRAIMPVHQLGLPADMDRFFALASRHCLAVVEDAACAVGATYRGRPVGSLSSSGSIPSLACFSFHPRKVITTGEGGMIAVGEPAVAERLRRLRAHGMDLSDLARHTASDVVVESYPERGWNCRMTDLQAALGLCQLEALDGILARRRVLAERYTEALSAIPGIEPPYEPSYAVRTWQSYCIRLCAEAPIGRTALMRSLLRDGISTRRGVMAIHLEAAYADPPASADVGRPARTDGDRPTPAGRAGLPHTEAAARETLLLPLFPDLSFSDQDFILDRLSARLLARAA